MAEGTTQILAFVGAPAAGKTIAASVAKEMGIPIFTMGDVIRAELRARGLSSTDENAGRIANELREGEGMDAIAKRSIPLIKELLGVKRGNAAKSVLIIDGIRGVAEVERFKKEFGTDFVLVQIDAPVTIRYRRIKNRGRADDSLTLDEFKQREERENRWGMEEAMKNADKVVTNEGSLAEFKKQIQRIFTAFVNPEF